MMSPKREDVSEIVEAHRFQWAARAKAYDTHEQTIGRPRDLLSRAFQALVRLVLIDAEALLKRAMAQPEGAATLTAGEMVKVLQLLVEHPEILTVGIESKSDANLANLPVDDIRKLLEAQKILRKASVG
jgi:hypothetical protein